MTPKHPESPQPDGNTKALRVLLEQGYQRHLAGELGGALAAYRQVLAHAPDQPDALNLIADIAQRQGRESDARNFLNRALQHHPEHSPARLARAELALAGQRALDAEADFRVVAERQPGNAEAWDGLARSLAARGRLEDALAAQQRAAEIRPRHAGFRNNLGLVLERLGRLEQACIAYREATKLDERSFMAFGNLGNALQKLERLEEAESAYRRALQLRDDPLIRGNLAAVLHRRERLTEAAAECRRAVEAAPNAVHLWVTLGAIENGLEAPERAERALRKALEMDPGHATALNNLALALQRQNRIEEAEDTWRKVLDIRPDYLSARANLADLYEKIGRLEEARATALSGTESAPADLRLNWVLAKCDRRTDRLEEGLARLDKLSAAIHPPRWRQSIAFERGKILDRLDRVDEAWRAFGEGNRIAGERWRSRSPGPNEYRLELETLAERLTSDWVDRWSNLPMPDDGMRSPVFLIGFPRSGTTLLDRMLDAHPGIDVIEEGPMLAEVLAEVEKLQPGYPDALAALDEERRGVLRATYFTAAGIRPGRPDSPVLVDKLPLNAARAALIHRLFPDARFLLAMRHPADVCLSCWMQEFGFNSAMANFFDLGDTVALYRLVMDLWHQAAECLKLDAHTVRYESLVTDTEAELRALLEYLRLPWNDSVLDHTARADRRPRINTPSYHQVVRPVYRESVDRWRRYREHLQPWLPALREHVRRHGYVLEDGSAHVLV